MERSEEFSKQPSPWARSNGRVEARALSFTVGAKMITNWSFLFFEYFLQFYREHGKPSKILSSHKTHRHWSRHTCCSVFVVVLSLITSLWVAAAAAGCTRSDAFFHSFLPTCRGDAANPSLESAFSIHSVVYRNFLSGDVIPCNFLSGDVIACICAFFLSVTARSLCTHQDRRQLQLSRRRWTAARQTHIFAASFYGGIL